MKAIDVKKKVEKESPGTVFSGESLTNLVVPRLPTGSLVLDLISGGGIPAGRITVFHGGKSSGKSTLSLSVAGAFQRANPDSSVALVDFEHGYDQAWAKNFIPDFGRLHVVDPDYGEQGIAIAEEYCKADDVGLIVVDSVASMISEREASADVTAATPGGTSILINKLIKRVLLQMVMARKTGRTLTALIVNQVRAKFGAMAFGPQTSQPGGYFLGHMATMDVRFYQKEVKKVEGTPTLGVSTVVLDKNRVGLPKRSGEVAFYMRPYGDRPAGAFEESKVVAEYAKKTGILQKEGTDWVLGGRTFSTLKAVADAMSDRSFVEEVKGLILERGLDSISGDEDEDSD